METFTIALLHPQYNPQHLEEVKAEMTKRGAPVIRCIWSEHYGVWLAIEGCHRLRAAKQLGLTPIIKDISGQKTVRYQYDGESIRRGVKNLFRELQSDVWRTNKEFITFGEDAEDD